MAETSMKITSAITADDCLEGLRELRTGCVNLIFADPPYNIGVDYGKGKKFDRRDEREYQDWCQDWLQACERALTPDGSLWVLINDEWADLFGIMLRYVGLHRRSWIKWYETFGVNCTNKFNRTSRHLFYCVADPKHFTFNREAVTRPSDRQTKYKDKRANPNGKIWDDVWQIPRLCGTTKERIPGFPTQLPLALLKPIVGCSSNPGDLVVDPFCGSGTTGVVCKQLGRRFIGIESNPDYVELAEKRIAAC